VLVAALALGRAMSSVLFGVDAWDPAAYAAALARRSLDSTIEDASSIGADFSVAFALAFHDTNAHLNQGRCTLPFSPSP
jgi:hypothetical protein